MGKFSLCRALKKNEPSEEAWCFDGAVNPPLPGKAANFTPLAGPYLRAASAAANSPAQARWRRKRSTLFSRCRWGSSPNLRRAPAADPVAAPRPAPAGEAEGQRRVVGHGTAPAQSRQHQRQVGVKSRAVGGKV